jgi:hypothetical protein
LIVPGSLSFVSCDAERSKATSRRCSCRTSALLEA